MKQDKIKYLEEKELRRLTGIKPETFEKMLEILSDTDRKKKARGGRRNKINLMVTACYFRIHTNIGLIFV